MGAWTRPADDDDDMPGPTRRKERRLGVYDGDTSESRSLAPNLRGEAVSHTLPTAADVETQFGLYKRDGACAAEITAQGEMACGCERCLRWKVRAGESVSCGVRYLAYGESHAMEFGDWRCLSGLVASGTSHQWHLFRVEGVCCIVPGCLDASVCCLSLCRRSATARCR